MPHYLARSTSPSPYGLNKILLEAVDLAAASAMLPESIRYQYEVARISDRLADDIQVEMECAKPSKARKARV